MAVLRTVLYLLVYPGLVFLFVYSTFCEWFDRKVYARLQNRMGPTHTGRFGLLQPIADFVKLMAKEDIVPDAADKGLFSVLPAIGLAVVSTAGLLLPVWNFDLAQPGWTSFPGDIIVMLYLLSLPTLILFLAAWSSTNLFSTIGGARVLTMLFGYEVPLFLAVLSPAILADSWRLAEIAAFYQARPLLILPNLLGFVVGLVIVLQTMYASTLESLGEFATLKALGASASSIRRFVASQALLIGCLGSALGLLVPDPLAALARAHLVSWIETPLWLRIAGAAVGMAICAVAALSASRTATTVDPVRVLRG